jgi:hypothetical protein
MMMCFVHCFSFWMSAALALPIFTSTEPSVSSSCLGTVFLDLVLLDVKGVG